MTDQDQPRPTNGHELPDEPEPRAATHVKLEGHDAPAAFVRQLFEARHGVAEIAAVVVDYVDEAGQGVTCPLGELIDVQAVLDDATATGWPAWPAVGAGPHRHVPYAQDAVDRPDDLEVVTADAATVTPLDELGHPLPPTTLPPWLRGPLRPPGIFTTPADPADEELVAALRDRVIRSCETDIELRRAHAATPEGRLEYAWAQLRDDVAESTSALRTAVVLAGYALLGVARVARLAPRVAGRATATLAVRSLL